MKKPLHRRAWFWVVLVLVTLVASVLIAIDPIAEHFLRKELAKVDGFDSDFERVNVSLLRLSVSVERLKLTDKPVTEGKKPTFYAEHIEAKVVWNELLKLHPFAHAQVRGAKINTSFNPPEHAGAKLSAKKPPSLYHVPKLLEGLVPFKIVRVEVRESDLLVVDNVKKSNAKIWLHDIEMSLESSTTKKDLAGARPTTFAMSAEIMRSGRLTVFATASPLIDPPAFTGEARLLGFDLHDIEPVFTAFTGRKMPKGAFDCVVAFKSEKGKIVGAVTPVLEEVDRARPENGLGKKLLAAIGDVSINLASDHVPGRNASEIPLRGTFTSPDVQIVPAILGVVRNAFVIGLSERFANVPSKPMEEKQRLGEQARESVSKKKVAPKSQPPRSL